MTLIRVVKKEVADLPSLSRLVLRFIYEPEKMRREEIDLMQESLKHWVNHIKMIRENRILTPANLPNSLDNQEEYIINRIASMLQKDSQGGFEKRKQLFRERRISWRKFHRLPEAYTPEDFIKAAALKKEYDMQYPEFR